LSRPRYANADLRRGGETEELFRLVEFSKWTRGKIPRHLVFDSALTTHANLARLEKLV
jgi:hypothetical protein